MVVLEYIGRHDEDGLKESTAYRFRIGRIVRFLCSISHLICIFLFGAGASVLITDTAKFSIGRLRFVCHYFSQLTKLKLIKLRFSGLMKAAFHPSMQSKFVLVMFQSCGLHRRLHVRTRGPDSIVQCQVNPERNTFKCVDLKNDDFSCSGCLFRPVTQLLPPTVPSFWPLTSTNG